MRIVNMSANTTPNGLREKQEAVCVPMRPGQAVLISGVRAEALALSGFVPEASPHNAPNCNFYLRMIRSSSHQRS